MNTNSPVLGNASTAPDGALHLTIDSHVVVQLGAELITDPEQALLELIKNSYDADADWCNVIVSTEHEEDIGKETGVAGPSAEPSNLPTVRLKGRISIEDNGHGMKPEQIRNGWLSISLSFKRQSKEAGELTAKHNRFPMGDKGLGRISSMRLGDLLRVTTHFSPNESGRRISFRWSDCRSGVSLENVPVHEEIVPPNGRTGTTVEIVGLHDLNHWRDKNARSTLQAKMSSMVSPFAQFKDFVPSLEVDGKETDFVSLSSKVLNAAVSNFSCKWSETYEKSPHIDKRGQLTLAGRIKLDLFRGKDKESFDQYVVKDKGEALLSFLKACAFASRFNKLERGKDGWFIEFSSIVDDADIPLVDTTRKGKRAQKLRNSTQSDLLSEMDVGPRIAFPGPFESQLYGYSYESKVFETLLAGEEVGKEVVQELSGVAVFRDGFRVRTGSDWLRFSDSLTSGGSYYALRPRNTLGFVALTSQFNAALKETSNRENFVDNDEWKVFYTLMTTFRDFANDSLEDFRRNYIDFIKRQKGPTPEIDESNVNVQSSPHQVLEHFSTLKRMSEVQQQRAATSRATTLSILTATSEKLSSLREQATNKGAAALADELRREVTTLRQQVEESLRESETLHRHFIDAASAATLLRESFDRMERQMEEAYEQVAVGLAAQGVVHDIHGLIDEILSRLSRIESAAQQSSTRSKAVDTEVATTRTLIRLIGKQLSALNPMLRQYRERRETISMVSFLSEFFALRESRYDELGFHVYLPATQSDFTVTINRGRLTQVIDNIVRNSEYWLLDAIGKKFKIVPEIHIEIEGATVIIWDSGRGVRKEMENVLFDLFVTDKPREHGQGLGLFIVKQLLQYEGCAISLGPDRNAYGRRFRFYIDFSGVADGGN